MAIKLFLLLNAMGVAFLLYALSRFWSEGHRPENGARPDELKLSQENRINVFIMTYPISSSAQGGLSVIPINAMARNKERVQTYRLGIEKRHGGTTRFSAI